MVENGSNPGVKNLFSNFPHERFVELCALSTTEELSPEERQMLEEHLVFCVECRDLKSQYEAVVGRDVPALAFESRLDGPPNGSHNRWSLEQSEASLMAALDREEAVIELPKKEPAPAKKSRLRSQAWPYAIAASLVGICSLTAYQLGVSHKSPEPPANIQPPVSSVSQPPALLSADDKNHAVKAQTEKQAILKSLRSQLADSLKEVAALKQQQTRLQEELTNKNADLAHITAERADLDRQLNQAQANVSGLQEKLSLIALQKPSEPVRTSVAESQLQDIRDQIQERDQQIAQDKDLLQHDRDIRNLISARDLYIAEIYDVGKKGETNKPFGRVFYTRGKSLVFYAYDLDQQPGLKRAAIFQAWGRKGSDPKSDINLGIFYQDDSTNKRWILKSSDPRTLAQIDAVFVTVETKPESSKPSGKPLLFTYLRIPPNHP